MRTTVTARRPFTAASSTTVRDRDFLLRPHPRPADILQGVLGFYVVQHAGGGKANQYFLRGFDADHGTDVALSVDGIPVNMVSHGHGQGYADLNWVIPELIERVEVRKGPYFAQDGDSATAGAVNPVTRRDFESSQLTVGGGSFDTWRGLFIAAPDMDGWSPVVAGQVYGTHGPFLNPEKLQRYSLFSVFRAAPGWPLRAARRAAPGRRPATADRFLTAEGFTRVDATRVVREYFEQRLKYGPEALELVRRYLKEHLARPPSLAHAAAACRDELPASERMLLLDALYGLALVDGPPPAR